MPAGVAVDGVSFAPGLLGRSAQDREWAYSEGGKDRYWVRTQRWKLCSNGKLFDVQKDPEEKHPVPKGTSAEADAARMKLSGVLRKLRP